jgi:hypothetical protein
MKKKKIIKKEVGKMYQDKFVAVIKHNKKVLREINKSVFLPVLAEYEIFIKNLNSKDALVSILINETEDILDNQKLIIKNNSIFLLEGILNKNKVINKFKFTQETNKIYINFQFMKTNINHSPETSWCYPHWYEDSEYIFCNKSFLPIITYTGISSKTASVLSGDIVQPKIENKPLEDLNLSINSNIFIPQFDDTTPAPAPIQTFEDNIEDQTYNITLTLKNSIKENQLIDKPILVSTKVKCSVCGHKNRSNSKFCPVCGTAVF